MTITYEVGDGLYINMTNRCSNACTFCVRVIKDGVGASSVGDRLYGAEGSLWLEREPSLDEIIAEIKSRDLTKYSELVFCGYGRFDIVSISLNTSTSEAYVKVCRSVFGEAAWHNLLEFGAAVSKYVPKVIYSVVRATDPDEDLELCRRLAESHGGELRIREPL
jgi:wyosine [tRNA(Phe)-imidazoG37] synthetase (radical SAM superfamily)